MLDMKIIREKPEIIINDLTKRKDTEKIEWIDQIKKHDDDWKKYLKDLEGLRAVRNKVSKEISELKKKKVDAAAKIEEMKKTSANIGSLEKKVENVRVKRDYLILRLPNIMHESVPVGKDDFFSKR